MGNFIRAHLSEVEPIFLVSSYAAPLVMHHDPPFPYVIWNGQKQLRGYDVLIHVYPRSAIAWAGWRGGIPRRIGTSRRWYHWFTCTDLPRVARRHSGRHEAHLNLLLLSPLLLPEEQALIYTLSWEKLLSYRARLKPQASLPPSIKQGLAGASFRIGLHIGSGGGAPRWQHWAALVSYLHAAYPSAVFILTGGEAEKPLTHTLRQTHPAIQWIDTAGQLSLAELITLLAEMNVFIAGSTGPLHIAAAVGTPVIGLYPATAEMGPWRWAPLTPHARILHASAICSACKPSCPCLAAISPEAVLKAVLDLLQFSTPPLNLTPVSP